MAGKSPIPPIPTGHRFRRRFRAALTEPVARALAPPAKDLSTGERAPREAASGLPDLSLDAVTSKLNLFGLFVAYD
ncbi:hypothetical protein ACQEVM_35470 [Streptomyces sp. CA-243310]|uniref:hypothetical protein n=1 Tax=Streptomyces sp. CA-243310 TaxID=3240056 RepID=UPI003D8AA028